jgi:hypothetical protein
VQNLKSTQIIVAGLIAMGLSTSLVANDGHNSAAAAKAAIAPPPTPAPPFITLRSAASVQINGPEPKHARFALVLPAVRKVAQPERFLSSRTTAVLVAQRTSVAHRTRVLAQRPRPVRRTVAKPTTAQPLVTALQMLQWTRVAICEEGGNWHVIGSKYSGGLGITNVNWIAYGGLRFASNAGLATPQEQVFIAIRIQSTPPDQNGCTGSW